MNYFLLFLSAGLGASTSLVSRVIKRDSGKLSVASTSNAATFLVAFLTVALFGICTGGKSFFFALRKAPWGLSTLYGGAMMTAQFLFLLAVGRGPVSMSTLFYSCGFILPTFWGMIRFDEPITFLRIFGVALILGSFALSMDKKDEEKKADFLWWLFAVGAAVCSGIVGVAQKEFSALNACSIDVFLFLSFACSTAFGSMLALVVKVVEKDEGKTQKSDWKRALLGALPLGVIMGCANKLNTYLAGVFESVVTFPCVNGGRIVLTAILSAWIFKEKTVLRQKIAVVVGFLGIICISI